MTLTHDPLRWLLVIYMTGVACVLIAWWWENRKTIKLKTRRKEWEDE